MGTDLTSLTDHFFDFDKYTLKEINDQALDILNRHHLPNVKELEEYSKYWNEIGERREWINAGYFDYQGVKQVFVHGPYGLSLYIDAKTADIFGFNGRYYSWLSRPNDLLEEGFNNIQVYRKVFASISKAIGGNKILYGADNSHPSELVFDFNGSVDEMIHHALVDHQLRPYWHILDWFKAYQLNHELDTQNMFIVDDFSDLDMTWEEFIS